MMHIHTVGGRRRLDLSFRRDPVARRAGIRRGRARPGLLSPWRAADGDRLQRHAGQAAAGAISLICSDLRATCRSTVRPVVNKFTALSVEIREGDRYIDDAGGDRGRFSCGSPSRIWRTPSRRFRSSAAMTSPAMRWPASVAPAASMPAWWPTALRIAPYRDPSSRRGAVRIRHGAGRTARCPPARLVDRPLAARCDRGAGGPR